MTKKHKIFAHFNNYMYLCTPNMQLSDIIKNPITSEISHFADYYDTVLNAEDGLLGQVLTSVRRGRGKLLRPQLVLLLAKSVGQGRGELTQDAYIGALSLELLHTASLIHDDVVDESDKRRGQPSINASFGNKVAVLSGDYILSTALRTLADSRYPQLVAAISQLGKTLSRGELLQLESIQAEEVSEETYMQVITGKTAALFETCGTVAAIVTEASEDISSQMQMYGRRVGQIFQIKDDILDYVSDSQTIGKPVGNDLREGKVTLPLIHAITEHQDPEMLALIKKVKLLQATDADIQQLIQFAIAGGGIEYAEQRMHQLRQDALHFVETITDASLRQALTAYIDFAIERKK